MSTIRQKIVPHLWYDREAREAAERYASLFPDSRVQHVITLRDTPSGDADLVDFALWGYRLSAISGGPMFRFNPSISLMVNFDPLLFGASASPEQAAREKLDAVWEELSRDGAALMPIGEYPFSRRYGWVQDRYGLSWQLILTDPAGEPRPPIMPSMLFVGENCGRAEEAIKFYLSVFGNSRPGSMVRYGADMEPDREGTVMFGEFMLEHQWFVAMDSAHEHAFAFNEAVSYTVECDDQDEVDYYWEKLSAVPDAEQCGWCKDRFGVSWQVVPAEMFAMLRNGTQEQIARVTEVFLPMKKFDIAALRRAYEGS